MSSPTPLRLSRTTPPIQQRHRSLEIHRPPANLQLTPLNVAFTSIPPLTPLSTVFTHSHRGVGLSLRIFACSAPLYPACPEPRGKSRRARYPLPSIFYPRVLRSLSATPAFSNSCALFFSLCALFARRPFVFNTLRALPQKHPGGGVPLRVSTFFASLYPACPEPRGKPRRVHYPLPFDFLLSCFHIVTNPSSHKRLIFTSIQNPRGCHPAHRILAAPNRSALVWARVRGRSYCVTRTTKVSGWLR
jgi:hypothetical protein